MSQWRSLYNTDTVEDEQAKQVLQTIHDSWVLVNIVDNAYYTNEVDIFRVFREVMIDSMSEVELKSRLLTVEAENFKLTDDMLTLQHERVRARICVVAAVCFTANREPVGAGSAANAL